jgi:hypothetical protein
MHVPHVNTGVSIPVSLHRLLRDAARGRQKAAGGRASVSGLISELLETHRTELEADAQLNYPTTLGRF